MRILFLRLEKKTQKECSGDKHEEVTGRIGGLDPESPENPEDQEKEEDLEKEEEAGEIERKKMRKEEEDQKKEEEPGAEENIKEEDPEEEVLDGRIEEKAKEEVSLEEDHHPDISNNSQETFIIVRSLTWSSRMFKVKRKKEMSS